MRRLLAGALLVLASAACRRDATEGSAPPPASAVPVVPASSPGPAPAEPRASVSEWTKDSSEPLELAVSQGRAAVVMFVPKEGYVLRRGETSSPLPRVWFGVGPPRRDLSISGDGSRLAIPEVQPLAGEGTAVTVYDTDAKRFFGRFAVPQKELPAGGGFEATLSVDGKHVVWTFTRRPCMVTEMATGTLDVEGAKHKKCVGGDTLGKSLGK